MIQRICSKIQKLSNLIQGHIYGKVVFTVQLEMSIYMAETPQCNISCIQILVSVFSLNLCVLILDSTQYLSCLNPILHHGYGKRLFLMGWLLKSISGQFKHKSCQQLTVSINHSRYIHTCHVIGELPSYFALAGGHGISSITHSGMTK